MSLTFADADVTKEATFIKPNTPVADTAMEVNRSVDKLARPPMATVSATTTASHQSLLVQSQVDGS